MSAIILPNTTFAHDNKYFSENSFCYLVFQKDGNLVLYKTEDNKAIWSTSTHNKGKRCTLQSDGNLVVYDDNKALWSSGTHGNTDVKMSVLNNGAVAIYNKLGKSIWSSKSLFGSMMSQLGSMALKVAEEMAEAERQKNEKIEADRLEAERLDAIKKENERLEAERLEAERLDAIKKEAERLEAEKREAERLEAIRKEEERLEAIRKENARLEAIKREEERLEALRKENERLEAIRREEERLEAIRKENARLEAMRKIALEHKKNCLQSDINDLEAKIDKQEKILSSTDNAIKELYANITKYENNKKETIAILNKCHTDLDKKKEEMKSLNLQ